MISSSLRLYGELSTRSIFSLSPPYQPLCRKKISVYISNIAYITYTYISYVLYMIKIVPSMNIDTHFGLFIYICHYYAIKKKQCLLEVCRL